MAHSTRPRSKLGSKREVSPGKWIVRVSVGYQKDGAKQRRVTKTVYGTERDADRKLAELSADMGRYKHLGDGTTLQEYWDAIYHPRLLARVSMRDSRTKRRKLTKGTLKRYEGAWRRCLQPAFGDWDVKKIRHADVQGWAYSMTRGEADHAVRLLRTILREAWAVDELIDQQPLPRPIDLPGEENEPAEVWSAAEVMAAKPLMEGTPIEAVWLAMVGGGLRKEEACALYWRDLEFADVLDMGGRKSCVCLIRVTEAYTLDDGRKDTKTRKSKRTVPVGEPFSSRLRELAGEPDASVLPIGLSKVCYAWARLWEPAERSGAKYYKGRMLEGGSGKPIVRRVELRTMRHAHECMMAGILNDADNSLMHGHSREVSYEHYRRLDNDRMAAAAVSLGSTLAAVG